MGTRGRVLVVAAAGLAVVGLFAFVAVDGARRREAAPGWLDPHQPPQGVAARLSTLTPAQSMAANGCPTMAGCCAGRSAGSRLRRVYPSTLMDDPSSVVRASFALGLGR
jgi:hypothetical protein